MKKILTVLLAALLLLTSLSMFACNDDETSSEGSKDTGAVATNVTFAETNIDLVKSGTTKYSIVVPENTPKYVTFAADELQALFLRATGITLNIVVENSQMTTQGYYLSLGNTILQEQSGVNAPTTGKKNPFFVRTTDEQIMGEMGAFSIERKDNTLIMVGIDDQGTVFAAYEFLEKQLGYEYYAADEIKIDTVADEKLLDFKWSYAPYAVGNQATDRMSGTKEAGLRYRMYNTDREMHFPHSWLTVIPYKTYGADHPDWFGASGKALCISNPEMAKEYAKRVVELWKDTTYATHMAGQEDDWAKCGCANCQKSDAKYLPSGTNVIFINRVCNEIDRILAEQGRPDFRYRIVMLAYYQYEAPPTTLAGTEWVPLADEVKFHPNAGVHLCLFGAGDAAQPLTEQPGAIAQIEGWLSCDPDAFELYIYRGYFPIHNLAFPFDWANLKDWIVTAKEYGSLYNVWSIPAQSQFEAMRAYVHGQLCYDPTQDTNDLIDEFIDVYYKDAAPKVKQFFEEITSYMYMKNEENKAFNFPTLSGGAGHLLDNKKNWPEEMLVDWVEIFDEAYALAAAAQDMTQTQRDILEVRIDDESLWPRYWLVKYYGKTHYTTEEYAIKRKEVLDDALRAGYTDDAIIPQLDR